MLLINHSLKLIYDTLARGYYEKLTLKIKLLLILGKREGLPIDSNFLPIKHLIKSLVIGQRGGGFEVIGNYNIFF